MLESKYHVPVLQEEVVNYLLTDPSGIYVDGTVGGGGHAEEICKRLGRSGRLICMDADQDAIASATGRLAAFADRIHLEWTNFRNMKSELKRLGIQHVHGILLDLGVSSYQIDAVEKGFSFRSDEQIDMRMDRRQHLTGWHVVNRYDEKDLAALIWRYGEEKNAKAIARRIVAARDIHTTEKLREVVEGVVGKRFLVKSLARVFQAIRIEVNDELTSLEHFLRDGIDVLYPGGRLVIIAYHSLEDRIVKQSFREASATRRPSGHKYIADTVVTPRLRIVTKRPVRPGEHEILENRRARSAKMRVAERI